MVPDPLFYVTGHGTLRVKGVKSLVISYLHLAKNIVKNQLTLFNGLTLTVTEIHPMTYGQSQGYRFLGHQS